MSQAEWQLLGNVSRKMNRPRSTLVCVLIATAAGCGTFRVGIGPTADTLGNVGVMARVGGGLAVPVPRRDAVLVTGHVAAGGGGGDFAFAGADAGIEYQHQPMITEQQAANRLARIIETGRGARLEPGLSPFVLRVGAHAGGYAMRPQYPTAIMAGVTFAFLGALRSTESSRDYGTSPGSSSKGAFDLRIHVDWLKQILLGAELDADLLSLSSGTRDGFTSDSTQGRFSLLLVWEYTAVGYSGSLK